MSPDDFAPVVRDADPAEQAEEEERRRGPVGLGRAGRNVAMLALTLSGGMQCGMDLGGGARPDVPPVLFTPEEESRMRAEAEAANARAAARSARGQKAAPDKKRQRRAERAARKKNRR